MSKKKNAPAGFISGKEWKKNQGKGTASNTTQATMNRNGFVPGKEWKRNYTPGTADPRKVLPMLNNAIAASGLPDYVNLYIQQQALNADKSYQMYLADYNMRRKYGFGTNYMNRPDAVQFNRFRDQLQQPKAKEQETKPAGFQDWSMAQNLLDPNSKLNGWIAGRPQEEQDYWNGIRTELNKANQVTLDPKISKKRKTRDVQGNGIWDGLQERHPGQEFTLPGQPTTGNAPENTSAPGRAGVGKDNIWGGLLEKYPEQQYVDKNEINRTIEQRKRDREDLIRIITQGITNPQENYEQYIRDMNLLQGSGYYSGDDNRMMSDTQLRRHIEDLQKQLVEAREGEAQYKERTAEEQKQSDESLLAAESESGKYRILAEKGLPMMLDYDGEEHPMSADEWRLSDEINYTYLQGRPEDYDNYSDLYDTAIYDWFHGEGAYQNAIDNGTDEEWEAVVDEVDRLWDMMDSGEIANVSAGMQEETSRQARENAGNYNVRELERQLQLAQEEQQRRKTAREYEANAPEGTEGRGHDKLQYDFSFDKTYNDARNIYANLNGQERNISDFGKMIGEDPGQYMTDAQRNAFKGYFEAGQYAEAMAYYNALEPWLRQLMNKHKSALESKMYNEGWGIPMTAYRILTKPAEGVTGLVTTTGALLGNREMQDPNSKWWDLSRTNMNIQNTSAKAWARQAAEWFGGGDEGFAARAAEFFNGVFFSIADNLTAFALSGGASNVSNAAAAKLSQYMIQFVMSSEATASTMFEALENGMDPTEAAISAFGNGIIEAITEKWSLEKILDPSVRELLGTKGAFLKYLGKSALAEGSEEILSDMFDTGLDYILSAIYGNEAELTAQYNALIAEGMDPTEATWIVIGDYAKKLGQSGLAGALSGLLMSGSRGVKTRMSITAQDRAAGRNIRNYGQDANENKAQRRTAAKRNIQQMVEGARKMSLGTESREKAERIQRKMDKGQQASPAEIGSLYRSLMQESGEKVRGIVSNVMGDAFSSELAAKGEKAENIPELSKTLANIVAGQATTEDLTALAKSEKAAEVLREYRMGDEKYAAALEEIKEETKGFRSQQETLGAMAVNPKSNTEALRATEAKMEGATTASKADVMLAGGSKNAANEVLSDGKISTVSKINLAEDGDGGKVWQLTLENGEQVSTYDVKAVNTGMAQTLRYLENDGGRTIGTNLAQELLQAGSQAKNAAQTVSDAVRILYGEMLGQEAVRTSLNTKTENAIRAAVQADMQAAEEQRISNRRDIKPGSGKVTYKGAAYGSNAFNEALKGLGKNVRTEAEAIASIAKSAGFDVELYYDANDSANQGSYSTKTGIRLNLAGTFNKEGAHRSALATMSHEVTHWLESNSPNEYRNLRKFVLSTLQKTGTNVAEELNKVITNYAAHGVEIDLNGAVAEMVAKGCEQVLTNEKVVQQLKEQDPTLHGKIRQAIEQLVNKIRDVIGDARATSSRYARALAEYADELSKVWLKTYEEAKMTDAELKQTVQDFQEAVKNGDETAANEALQHSLQEPVDNYGQTMGMPVQYRKDGMIAVHNMRADRFAKALHIGGFAMPSTAIIPAGEKWTNFSDISIFFGKKTIDPSDPENMLYSGDAYTPMFRRDSKEFDNMDEAMEALKAQEERMMDRKVDSRTLIQDYLKIPDLDSGRALLYAYKNMSPEERQQVWVKMFDKQLAAQEALKNHILHGSGSFIDKMARLGMNEKRYEDWAYEYALDRALFRIYEDVQTNRMKNLEEDERQAVIDELTDALKVLGDRHNYHFEKADTVIDAIMDYVSYSADNANSAFLEAKPWRPVAVTEVGMVLMPKNVDPEIVQLAIDSGIPENMIDYYANEAERKEKIMKVPERRPDLVFSVQEDEKALEQDLKASDGTETHYGDTRKFSLRVTDPEELKFLDGQDTVTTYKSMQLIDGKLYPPMAAVVAGNMEDYSELGKWEKATEHPELIKSGNKFTLNKGKGKGSLDAAYNPYMHSSNLMINDQFSGAYNRPNLVTVECKVPVSELTSGYHAEFAKDSVGWHGWHTGPVAGQLRQQKGQERQVMLSRWIQPVRIVPDAEVAQHYKELLQGTDIAVPDNVVTPALREELIKAGVNVSKSGRVMYSLQDNEIRNGNGDVLAEVMPGNTITKYSYQSWEDTDIEELEKDLIARGFKKKDVKKWIRDVNGVAALIAARRDVLDYEASPYFSMLKNNQEYVKTLDASTLCAKRLLYQGIFNEIQSMLPNTPILPEDLINLINMMKKEGLVTPCGICYVESRRRMLGKYAQQWLDGYQGAYKPQLAEVTTTDGLEKLRKSHPQAYDDFIAAMKAKGSANPKVVETRTDYRNREIMKLTDKQVEKVKEIGGLRVQSFSDFEIIHMIDMMQAVMDMAAKELTSQAYTKVPEFAWVFGDTGIKINLSEIGKGTGYSIKGGYTFDDIAAMPYEQAKKLINLEYDDKEGMPHAEAMKIRDRYSKNVGTILVGMNNEHVIAAMADDEIDFIIPFHKSGWSKAEMARVSGMSTYKDFTRWQNEKKIGTATKTGVKTIPNKKSKISNFGPVNGSGKWDGQSGYWDFRKTGTENAIEYLRLCKEDGRVPKFANFLEYDGDGGYRLPSGNDYRSTAIRNGYWKMLIDFKMYDNEGKGSPQTEVKPNFNMERATDILEKYNGETKSLPTDHDLAKRYVDQYKKDHPNRKQYSMRDDTDYDVRSWMESVPEWSLQTEAERQLLGNYKSLRTKMGLDRLRMQKIDEQIRALEGQIGKAENQEAEDGNPVRVVTIEDALKINGVWQVGKYLTLNGKQIGTLQDGILNITKDIDGIKDKLAGSGAFDVDERTGMLMAKAQNIHADDLKDAQRKLDALRIKKQNLQGVMDQTQDKLAKILGDEGFGRMMYQQQKVLDDLQTFGTQKELNEHVARMERAAREIAKRIDENKAAVDNLAKSDAVKRFRELLGTTTAEKTAAELKKEFSSTWTAKQIRTYLDPIILKMKTGADFQQDVETLAGILVGSDSRNRYEALEDLRGLVITLGKGAQAELKAQNSSLKEVRARLAGTGIQVKYGDRSTLEADIEDLRAEYPMIPELGDEKDALGNFLNWVDSMKSASAGMEFYDQRIAEAMAVITGKAAGAAKGIYMPNDPKAQQQVLAMMDFVKGMSAETAEAQKALADIAKQMASMQKESTAATGNAKTLMRDVNVALDYYNRISKIAVDEAKQKKQSAVIEQLKSEHAKKILKNNEEWRAQIQRDAESRKQLEENQKAKNQINTCLKRLNNLLKNPKGLQNIPEHMQGLAREMISKFIGNDYTGGNKLTTASKDELTEMMRLLNAWEQQSGKFNPADLNAAEDVKTETMLADLDKITDGIRAWNNDIRGKNKLDTLQQRGAILKEIQEAVSEIYTAIRTEGEVQVGDRRVAVEDAAYEVAKGTGGKKFREWTGSLGQKMGWLHKAIVSGNMTPEYYFRTLGNQGLSDLWENYHWAENRNGLELKKAQERLAEIAKDHGFKDWDLKQKIKLNLQSGDVEITLGQLMSLWATWKREKTLGPQMSEHLTKGGFYAEQDTRDGLLGRTAIEKRAHRVTEEDMEMVREKLTEEQRKFIDDVVGYMSRDMSELGNAASMQAYGIKLYKEGYYFPFQMWDGVKSRKSNDAGGAAAANDRAFHPSFSKTRIHGANNAVMIGDFMQVATDHIAGMINYATMGLANENLQKVLNAQTAEGEYGTKRNTRALIEEAYGREAAKYLADLQMQLNGGAVHIDKTFYDKLISLFRKNAVAGSLSVALQQPLSYIRAAMMINPKYLARAISPDVWKGSYKEMLAHSGVAVIKDMGRFDMNFGQSAKEFLMPDGKEGKFRKVWEGIEEYSTKLPELMDRMTWTRMWSAVKAEQKAQHPEMDVKSDEFLDMVGVRFNDLMRRTQVYDSTLVKSANMRTQNPVIKTLTSFMAEPTLTLNVLADSVRMAKNHEKGGMQMVGKASGLFLLSAVLQAAVKGLMGTGRTPDDKKTWWENFLYRFEYNFLNEADILQLVPGFSDVVTILKGGELKDDAWGALSKMIKAGSGTVDLLLRGPGEKGLYRDAEDSGAQLVQMFTGLPAKNIMRDLRAMWNWTVEQPYADRENSAAVISGQASDLFYNADNLIGVINNWLGDAGYNTDNNAYYQRIYEAKKAGDKERAQSLIDYLLNGKGVKQESIDNKIAGMAKKDENASAADIAEFLIEEGASAESFIKEQMKTQELTAEEARKLLQKAQPEKDADTIWWTVDRIQYQIETGAEKVNGNYYRLWDAMDNNKATEIRTAVKTMTDHGMDPKNIKTQITKQYKDAYLNGTNSEKVKIKDAIEKAYKELGFSTEDADKVINKWK